ncbi:MAG: tRNA (adenosine(37)-N6)-threonylcarbamoyltransferase complex dimerization subunit type 1 TsaB [Chlamydiota bacterium]
MKFLIIDTSGPDSFVCLWDRKSYTVKLLPPLKQSRTLLPAIRELLKRQTVDFIAIGTGPGSFTGTRIGVMTAKTLAFTWKLPLVPFCSLKIYTPNQEGPFILFSDAKSRGTFALEGVRSSQTASFKKPYIKKGKEPPSEGLNLSFLGGYLCKKFVAFDDDFSLGVPICYLGNP